MWDALPDRSPSRPGNSARTCPSLGHLATAVAWLANTLAAYGAALDAEHVILPGAMTTAPLIGAGQKAEARFGALGSVSVSFV